MKWLGWFGRFAKRRVILIPLVVVLILIGGGIYYTQSGSSSTPQYETVAASLGNISQSISISGTIEPVTNLELNFGSSGLVTAVNVQPGQSVKSGQVMATLDTTSLKAQVAQAQAALLSSEAKLSSDQSGPTASQKLSDQEQITNAQNSLASAKQSLTDTEASNNITLQQAQSSVTQAQAALTNDQTTLLTDQQSFAAAQLLVAPATSATSTPVPQQPNASAFNQTTIQNTIASNQTYITEDQGALANAQQSLKSCGNSPACSTIIQSWISQDDTAISDASTSISAANKVTGDLQSLQSTQLNLSSTQLKINQSVASANQAIASAQQALANAQSSASINEQPATASQIDSDNAAIASAKASLANAQQALSEATITAPMDGVIAQVNISAGKNASSTSTTGDLVLESANSFEVSGQVSDTQISEVHLNQQALVTPAGQTTGLTAKVNQITPMATVTQGVATFPINVLITQQSSTLYAGASATVQIIVKQANNVLTVPTSAVHSAGSVSYVDVLQNGTSSRKLVTLGASSGIYTEVTSGLQPGDQVVIANRSASLPSANSNNFRVNRAVGGIGGGGGGFVGGGRRGG